ncbi:MAG: hypothetical protein RhofKO_40080 [Rhodothermales bacterium]
MQFRSASCLNLYGLGLLIFFAGCSTSAIDPTDYERSVALFYRSLAALQAGEDLGATDNLLRVTELSPDEPAAYLNLAIVSLRRNAYDAANRYLDDALRLDPTLTTAHFVRGLIASNQGDAEAALKAFQDALASDSADAFARYALVRELERADPRGSIEARLQHLSTLLNQYPGNMAVALEQTRLAAQQDRTDLIRQRLDQLREQSATWPADAQDQLTRLQALLDTNPDAIAVQVAFLRNMLLSTLQYRQDVQAVQPPPEVGAPLVTELFVLPTPISQPAQPDTALTFAVSTALASAIASANLVPQADGTSIPYGIMPEGALVGLDVSAEKVQGSVALDYNYDFNVDLVLLTTDGPQLFEQDSLGAFTAVPNAFPSALREQPFEAAWVADIDSEGDLDLVLAQADMAPVVLRNQGDGTFDVLRVFGDLPPVQHFAWADLDADGDPDAAFLTTSGELLLYANERLGRFEPLASAPWATPWAGFTIADLDQSGTFDLIALDTAGALAQWSKGTPSWVALGSLSPTDTAHLFAHDIDNNGALDLIITTSTGSTLQLSDEQLLLRAPQSLEARITTLADADQDGRLDLLGTTPDQQAVWLMNQSTAGYQWQRLRPRAAQAIGDQRINAFAIGGEAEVRAGLLYQKQLITQPIVHFGLGTHAQSDVVRIVWPNGDIQAEFDLSADQTILTPQRLKGSCPWVFAYNGEEMSFVTDFIWRSPLGLRINAQETAGVMTTEDWVRIRGDQLKPKDGVYDIRITAELWETHFFDHVSLLVVDHPTDTEVFVDERFAIPPPDMAAQPLAPLRPIVQAISDTGLDVTADIATQDDRHLDFFGKGHYQGVTREHYVELDLGPDVPASGAVLVGYGWVRPTDSSINVALSQGTHPPPKSLSISVEQPDGSWQIAKTNLGFPAGKTKTVLLGLDGLFVADGPRRIRLHTNLEIYWDHLAWSVQRDVSTLRTQRLAPISADLRYRGFSETGRATPSAALLPDYQRLRTTAPLWRDLEGYYTRFGDVNPLLNEVDDRYVIMNAGDEMRFTFEAPPPPPESWTRDFVLIGEGWVKDGDLNTVYGRTVRPLPTHASADYSTPPGRLQDDPVYRHYPEDWQTYHTRYVAPDRFHHALVPPTAP